MPLSLTASGQGQGTVTIPGLAGLTTEQARHNPWRGEWLLVVDIAGHLETKLTAIGCYRSQFPPENAHVYSRGRALAETVGLMAGCAAGELLARSRMPVTTEPLLINFSSRRRLTPTPPVTVRSAPPAARPRCRRGPGLASPSQADDYFRVLKAVYDRAGAAAGGSLKATYAGASSTLTIWLNGQQTYKRGVDSPQGPLPGVGAIDKLQLQSHWGSGVRFKNIKISD